MENMRILDRSRQSDGCLIGPMKSSSKMTSEEQKKAAMMTLSHIEERPEDSKQ